MLARRLMSVMAPSSSWRLSTAQKDMWLDASDAESLYLSSGKVSAWEDKSGNGRNAAQATASLMPDYLNNSVVFTNDRLVVDSKSLDLNGKVVAVVLRSSVTCTAIYGGLFNLVSSNYEDPELKFGVAGEVVLYADGRYVFNNEVGCTNDSIILVSMSNLGVTLRVNGSVVVNTSGVNLSSINAGNIGYFIAANPSFNGHRDGTIFEICVFELDGSDLLVAEGELAHKWDDIRGVTTMVDALPSGHPYKLVAP